MSQVSLHLKNNRINPKLDKINLYYQICGALCPSFYLSQSVFSFSLIWEFCVFNFVKAISTTQIWTHLTFPHAISLTPYIFYNSCPAGSIHWLGSPIRSWNRDNTNWHVPLLPILEKFKNLKKERFRSYFIPGLADLSMTCQTSQKQQAITSNLAD